MSLNARRGCFRIVAPLDQGREEEIIGGLRNALERGEVLAKAKQSFINAGYTPEEVESAVRKTPADSLQTIPKVDQNILTEGRPLSVQKEQFQQVQPLPTTNLPEQKRGISKKLVIILVIISALILLGAGILGFLWDKL